MAIVKKRNLADYQNKSPRFLLHPLGQASAVLTNHTAKLQNPWAKICHPIEGPTLAGLDPAGMWALN